MTKNVPWIYNEDAALKLKLQGLTVADANNPARPVPVRYRLPEDELATLTYPIIIIEHIGMFPDPSREHRGYIQLPYAPEGFAQWWPPGDTQFRPDQSPYYGYFPLPYNLDYQVTVYCRKMAGHLQPLMTTLANQPYLPYHFGFLDIPQDNSIRTMFLMGGPTVEYGKDQDDKRLFRASYHIRVVSEIVPRVDVFGPFGQLVREINIDLGCYTDVGDLTTEVVAQNFGILSAGPYLAWDVALGGTYPNNGPGGTLEPRSVAQHVIRHRPSRAVTIRSNTR